MPIWPPAMPSGRISISPTELNILRLICGLFFIPHIVGKFTEPATLNFFKAAKFNPPATWMYIAGTIETFLTIGLVFAIYTPYVAAVAAFHLLRRRGGDVQGDQEVDLGDRRRSSTACSG